jgi:hypothetical protein
MLRRSDQRGHLFKGYIIIIESSNSIDYSTEQYPHAPPWHVRACLSSENFSETASETASGRPLGCLASENIHGWGIASYFAF